jgi:amino acid adenylation domain-containing protein/thioester reductase-like protein
MNGMSGRAAHLSPEQKRELLASLLRKKDAQSPTTAPLSYAQEAIWLEQQASPGSAAYHLACVISIHGRIDPSGIERVFEKLVERHAALRTVFRVHSGAAVQVTRRAPLRSVQCVDAMSWTESELERQLGALADQPFDLAEGPLFRVVVFRRTPQEHVLLLVGHHLVIDTWSLTILAREAVALFSEAGGARLTLPPMPSTFADYAWRQRTHTPDDWQSSREFWLSELSSELPPLALPTDHPRAPVRTYHGASYALPLGRRLSTQVRERAENERVTPYVLLLTAFQAFLGRYTGQDQIVLGSPAAGRTRGDNEGIVGCFINPLVLQANLAGNPRFHELLAINKAQVITAIEHQDYPFALLLRDLGIKRDPSRSPLFQVMFSWERLQLDGAEVAQAMGVDRIELRPMRGGQLAIQQRGAPLDLVVQVFDASATLVAAFQYNTDLFAAETIARMARHYRRLLAGAVGNPHQRISELPLLAPHERRLSLKDWNDTQVEYPLHLCLHQHIEAQARATPDRVAVRFEERQLTYGQLDRKANRLAHYLRSLGVGRDTIVAVCLERSLELPWALLGILKAGGTYLPIEPDLPPARKTLMLRDAAAQVVLTEALLVGSWADDAPHVIDLPASEELLAACSADTPVNRNQPDDLAYVIYTSGSTGQPKGVMIPHRGVCNRLLWMQQEFQLGEDDRVLQKTPFGFDVSVWEFFWPLMAGARLIVARPQGHRDAGYLVELILQEQVSTLHFVPPMLAIFLQQKGLDRLKSIKRVICSGEALTLKLQADFFARLPSELHNLYGPTEASIDVTAWKCRPSGDQRPVPIGLPIANTQIHILDRWMNIVPVGVTGEIYIGGVGLARGYINDAIRTAQRFVADPFSANPQARLYRTGDLARRRPDGSIEFLGRTDHQVKVDGHRIELGEIESALEQHPSVEQAHVLVRPRASGQQSLVAYVTGRASLDVGQLRRRMAEQLPPYMIPGDFVVLPDFPLTASGKVDRNQLPSPGCTRESTYTEWIAPRSEKEQLVSSLWAEVLGCRRVGLGDSIFDLGADSLQLHQIVARCQALHIAATVELLLRNPTLEAFVAGCERQGTKPEPVFDLAAEVTLAPDIRASHSTAAVASAEHILLTGTTGFLGAFLLDELLRRTSASIWCLVRGSSQAEGIDRLRHNLGKYGLWRPECESRIEVVIGDTTRGCLGLAEAEYDALAERVDLIYHNAAQVNFLWPYAALKPANVGGTQEILRLACRQRLKPVHFVSTLSVFDVVAGASGLRMDEDARLDGADIRRGTGYAQSKWVADKVAHLARQRGVPVTIYRPGLITGDSRTGVSNPDDLFSRMVIGCLQLGAAPHIDLAFAPTPVDYVASALVHLSQQPPAAGQTYHLANEQTIRWTAVVDKMRRPDREIELQPPDQWVERLAGHSNNALSPLLPLIRQQRTGTQLEAIGVSTFGAASLVSCAKTRQALSGSGITCPAPDETLLSVYIDFLLRNVPGA